MSDHDRADYYSSIPNSHTEQSIAALTKLFGSDGGERVPFKSRTQFLSSSYLGEEAISHNPWVQVNSPSRSNGDAAVSKNTSHIVEKDKTTHGSSKGKSKETIKLASDTGWKDVTVDTLLGDNFNADIELSILPEPKTPLNHREFDFEDYSLMASELDDDVVQLLSQDEESDIKKRKTVDESGIKEDKNLDHHKVAQSFKFNDQKASK